MPPLHINSPLIESRRLGLLTGKQVWLKLDAAQPPGSFKIRGIGLACQEYVRQGAQRLVCSSGGNAGIAVAYAARHLAVPALVVVPQTTTEMAKALIRQEGAELLVYGASWQEANAKALSLVQGTDAFLHPFDDPKVWRGHSTLVDEVLAAGVQPDAVALCVGGGGLLCGVVEGLQRHGLTELPVIAVETEGAASYAAALAQGRRVELPAITSIASSLGAKQVCGQALAWSRAHPIHSALVSDRAAIHACQNFLADHRLLVEPACGASLALAYERAPALAPFQSILIVVCGGAGVSVEQLERWAQQLA